jgi:predicted choloylglycine hydrolase
MAKGWLRNRHKRLTPFRELEIEHGSLKLVDGIPVVYVRGTHREMGRALGNLVGLQAVEGHHDYMGVFAPDFKGDLALAREMETRLPRWLCDEMLGFSESCELSYEQLLVGQCFLDIHKVAACSTIAAHDQLTETGEILMGRNLDFPSLSIADESNIVVVYEPEDGEPYAGVTWPGFLGILTGINTRGLALSMMLVYGHQAHEHLEGLPFPVLFRQLLHACGTVREADAILQQRPHCTATNLILGDATRTAARFELPPHDIAVTYTNANTPATACTNHYHEPKFKKFAFTWFSSAARFGRLQRRIMSGEKWNVQAIKDALQATGIPSINLQRVIMRPEKRGMEVSFDHNGTGPGRWVELPADLLFPGAVQPAASEIPEAVEAGI